MRCCVPSCKNDSRYISKSQGITFHVFPTVPTLRSAWLHALGKESWEPKERSAVCSEHFLCDDLYETKSGLRKVRAGAVPILLQNSSQRDFAEPANLKVCRICLVMDGKLFSMSKYKLDEAFEHLTGLSLRSEELPCKLCVECAHRLMTCTKFRHKALTANALMIDLLRKHDDLTVQNIQSLSREKNNLISSFTTKYFSPDHCDLFIEEIEHIEKNNEQIKSEDQTPEEDLDADVKNVVRNEIFTTTFDFDDEKPIDENDLNAEGDFVFSDKDYSSDDSLPLERRRTKKEKVKSKKETKKETKKKAQKKDPAEPKIDRRRKPFLNDDLSETLFTITDLTIEEQLADIEKRQESANYKNGVFKCTECYKGFLDEDAYNSHMSRHTNECGEHRCNICKTHFKHPHALRKHITAHHTQRFSCNQCPYVTTHRQSARLHERWHKGTTYKCPHCPDMFVKFTTYMGHIRIKHPSDFVCQLCGYSFVSEKGILLHKKLKHRQENIPIPEDGPLCELCNIRFISAEALKRHASVSARHNNTAGGDGRQPNKPGGGRRAARGRPAGGGGQRGDGGGGGGDHGGGDGQLRRAEGPIPCEQCGLQLEDSRAYHGHFRRMHPDKNRTNYPSMKSPCMCEVCGRMFQSYALLKDHRWVHTGERPFKCDACGKSFRMKQRLVAHRRVHSAQKATYLCTLCGKHFSTHSNRQRHMFIHTGLKPFKCEMCGKGFKHASEKRAHIQYVHLKKPWPKRSRGKRRPEHRQAPLPAQPLPAAAGDIDMQLWCDPKMDASMEDKPYTVYTLKL